MVDGIEIPRIELHHGGQPKTYWRMVEKYEIHTSKETLTIRPTLLFLIITIHIAKI